MKDNTELLAPRARSSGLVVREIDGEVLIYDLQRDAALALNRTAGIVWKCCDGETTVEEMAALVGASLEEPVGTDTIWHALGQLGEDHLLEEEAAQPVASRVMSRRSMMQKIGLAAGAAVVTTIVVPLSASAATCARTCGGSCHPGSNECPSGCSTCKVGFGTTGPASCTGGCCTPAGTQPPSGPCATGNNAHNSACCSNNCGNGSNQAFCI